eukprot:TRINITY_DN830_c0_g8_i1.p1 TRINITY_DN830_c0_g8~~TRINITY_DN830_c0_g8_i1.p1  ORF type:complete len:424 (+),score=38.52 TRINITY_DN830_c0_g8_i1:272-1543(+)
MALSCSSRALSIVSRPITQCRVYPQRVRFAYRCEPVNSVSAVRTGSALSRDSDAHALGSNLVRNEDVTFLRNSRNFTFVGQYRQMAISAAVADIAVAEPPAAAQKYSNVQAKPWVWTYDNRPININVVQHSGPATSADAAPILLLPAFSDVSTVEEWSAVATSFVNEMPHPVFVLDWPGFGGSTRLPLDYTADLMESFLTTFFTAADSPLRAGGASKPIVIGAGHAVTAVLRATAKGLITPSGIAAVAPTWAGPLPVVFGKSEKMEFRYAILRNALRTPGLGWLLYRYGLTSPKSVRMQYLIHVYADEANVTPELMETRTAVTRGDGARYAPASFLSGRLDAVATREEFVSLFEKMEEKNIPVLVLSTKKGPKRSKKEMEALDGAKGVSKYVVVPGALLPHEEYPDVTSKELLSFVSESVQAE